MPNIEVFMIVLGHWARSFGVANVAFSNHAIYCRYALLHLLRTMVLLSTWIRQSLINVCNINIQFSKINCLMCWYACVFYFGAVNTHLQAIYSFMQVVGGAAYKWFEIKIEIAILCVLLIWMKIMWTHHMPSLFLSIMITFDKLLDCLKCCPDG